MSDKTFHIVTFGCQMNRLDGELLGAEFVRRGMRPVQDPAGADVLLYCTCSVRQHAEDRVLSHLGSWRRRAEGEPGFVLGVVGCMAQRLGSAICDRFPHVRLVCGTGALGRVPSHVAALAAGGPPVVDLEDGHEGFCREPERRPQRHHAYVSIMRGCDNYCAYCIVPYVRGRERSRPAADVLDEVRRLADDGVVEVTLLGQNVNSYRKADPDGPGLGGLLEAVSGVRGLRRVRFVTNHPRDMSEEILRAVGGSEKVCEHIHMPAQSGSDAVLARMNRGYDRAHYLRVVEAARRLVPDVALSSDFLVGFPGEREGDFRQTLALLEDVGFQQSFVFKYSPRPGTLAARWPDDVPDGVKRMRNQRLLAAQRQIDTRRRAALVGNAVDVMVDGVNDSDREGWSLSGRTRQNDIVFFSDFDGAADALAPGALCTVRATESTSLTLFGRRLD